jgi:hypothetical protein
MQEPILDYVRRRLEEFRGQWPTISQESGVAYDTIAKLARGERPNPELKTLQPLIDWFNAQDAKAA